MVTKLSFVIRAMINQFAFWRQHKKCLHLKHLIADYGKVVVLVRYRWTSVAAIGLSDMDADSKFRKP